MSIPVTNAPENDSISVFFPCYNEQDNIRRVYESASRVLGMMGMEYELIIVDDGSTDQTLEIAKAIPSTDPRVKIVHHAKNRGYGAALQSGFRAATKTWVFYTDGDGQFDLGELPALIPLMKQYDIVSCFRLNRQDGIVRAFNAWCWNRLVCFLFRLKFKDINCAFKLYKRRIFDRMELRSNGALINTEILALAIRHGFAVTQVGVSHLQRLNGRQTGGNPHVIFRAFRELISLYTHCKS